MYIGPGGAVVDQLAGVPMLDELKDHFGFTSVFVRALPSNRPGDVEGKACGRVSHNAAPGTDRPPLWGAIRSEEFASWREPVSQGRN